MSEITEQIGYVVWVNSCKYEFWCMRCSRSMSAVDKKYPVFKRDLKLFHQPCHVCDFMAVDQGDTIFMKPVDYFTASNLYPSPSEFRNISDQDLVTRGEEVASTYARHESIWDDFGDDESDDPDPDDE